jgi:hypothetical protein
VHHKLLECGLAVALAFFALTSSCAIDTSTPPSTSPPSRAAAIPASAVKVTPDMDVYHPKLHSDEYFDPVPLGPGINTAGAEDSPFVMPDGNTLYFFFTPDAAVPAQGQLFDGVTGIWVSTRSGDDWTDAQRVVLQDKNELSLDGAEFVNDDELWFASARKGNYRDIDIWTARIKDGRWADWKNAGKILNQDYEVGEFHITADGTEMYFHSSRAGGNGAYDIWVTRKINGQWQSPDNIAAVNTPEQEGWPYVSQDGQELWFLRTYMGTPAIYRSKKAGDGWGVPELILSQFAGEPSLDDQGNLYFVHHFFKDNRMIEADIYVAYRK